MTESQQDKKTSKLPFRKQFKQINWYILHVHKQKSDDGLGGGDVVVVRLKPHQARKVGIIDKRTPENLYRVNVFCPYDRFVCIPARDVVPLKKFWTDFRSCISSNDFNAARAMADRNLMFQIEFVLAVKLQVIECIRASSFRPSALTNFN